MPRGGTVAVGGVLAEHGNRGNPQIHHGLFLALICSSVDNGIHNGVQFLSDKHRNDGGRRLVGSQTVIVARMSNRHAEQLLIIVHGLENGRQDQKELHVFGRGLSGIQQIFSVGGDGPVVMLARSVHARIGLFVKQADKAVLLGDLFHILHDQKILIHGNVGGGTAGILLNREGINDFVCLGQMGHLDDGIDSRGAHGDPFCHAFAP